MTRGNKIIILIFFIVLFFSGMLLRNAQHSGKRHYSDFRVYHHAGQVFLQGGDVYLRDKEGITPFKYSPFFAFCVSPLGSLPIGQAAGIFFMFNFLAAIAFLYWARKLSVDAPLASRRAFLFYFLILFFSIRFILTVWDSGQVNIILCALVAGALYFISKKKEAVGAAMLGGAIFIKYLPAIFIPYLLIRRRFKAAALTVLFSGLFLFIPALFIGFQRNLSYLSSWIPSIIKTSLDTGSYIDPKNQSLFSMFSRFFSDSPLRVNIAHFSFQQVMFFSYVVALGLYLLVLVPGKRNVSLDSPPSRGMTPPLTDCLAGVVDYALLFCLMALLNPNAWFVNFVALVVPYMVLLNYLFSVKWADVFVSVCIAASYIFIMATNHSLTGVYWAGVFENYSFVTIGTLVLMAALTKLKFFSPSPVKPEKDNLIMIKNILAIRNDRFGEFLLNIPALWALKETFPEAKLTLAVSEGVVDLAKCVECVDEVVAWDDDFRKSLKKYKFDVSVALNPTKEAHWAMFRAQIPVRVGYDRKWGILLTHRIADRKDLGLKHEVDCNLELVALVGAKSKKITSSGLRLPCNDKYDYLARAIAIHPYTSDAVKQWPVERFMELARRITQELKIKVILVGKGEDENFWIARSSRAMTTLKHFTINPLEAINLINKTNLVELAQVLKQCRLVVTCDSGPMHLAAAVGTRTVTLFRNDLPGKTALRWGPWGSGHIVIEKSSLSGISVDEVLEVVRKAIY